MEMVELSGTVSSQRIIKSQPQPKKVKKETNLLSQYDKFHKTK